MSNTWASAGRLLELIQGAYDATTEYHMLDLVFYNGSTYIAKDTTLGNAPTNTTYWQIFAQGTASAVAGSYYGECASAANVQNKVVSVSNDQNFTLQKGVILGVKFTYTNTFNASALDHITLNVNSEGAYPIYFGDTEDPTGTNPVAFGEADYIHYYLYDGVHWIYISRSGNVKLEDLNDVNLSSPSNGQALVYDSVSGKWVNATPNTTLAGLSDVQTTTPAEGDALVYDSNSDKWVNGESAATKAILDVYGAKNNNSYPYKDTSKVSNGITFTLNGDGSLFVGDAQQAQTATGNATFYFHDRAVDTNELVLKDGSYTVCGCPSGGSDESYYLNFVYNKADSSSAYVKDTGDGAQITVSNSLQGADATKISLSFSVLSGTTIPAGGMTVYPMIIDSRIKDKSWAPFAKTNRELTEDTKGTLKALGIRTQTITADGVKTWNDYLIELCNLVNTGLDSSYWIQFSGLLDATNNTFVLWTRQGMVQYNVEYPLEGLHWSALNSLKYNSVRMATTSNRCYMNSFPIIPSPSSGTSLLTTKPASGTTIYLSYYLYKQI